jgi:hypothetical protein
VRLVGTDIGETDGERTLYADVESGEAEVQYAAWAGGGASSVKTDEHANVGAWNLNLAEDIAVDSRRLTLNGGDVFADTNSRTMASLDVIQIGGRKLTSSQSLHFSGKIAYVVIGLGTLNDTQRDAMYAGYHPRVLESNGFGEVTIVLDLPLIASIDELTGPTLVNEGSVVFDSEDNPTVNTTPGSPDAGGMSRVMSLVRPVVFSPIRSILEQRR